MVKISPIRRLRDWAFLCNDFSKFSEIVSTWFLNVPQRKSSASSRRSSSSSSPLSPSAGTGGIAQPLGMFLIVPAVHARSPSSVRSLVAIGSKAGFF